MNGHGEEMEGVAETREMAIEVRGAYKGYGSLRVLRGLDMSVPRGRM
jgi:ABC-type transporter Mla maintaining outer membrane lipid asymmetry ATPase subunit MlaF